MTDSRPKKTLISMTSLVLSDVWRHWRSAAITTSTLLTNRSTDWTSMIATLKPISTRRCGLSTYPVSGSGCSFVDRGPHRKSGIDRVYSFRRIFFHWRFALWNRSACLALSAGEEICNRRWTICSMRLSVAWTSCVMVTYFVLLRVVTRHQ